MPEDKGIVDNYFNFDPKHIIKIPWYKRGLVYRIHIILYLLWCKIRGKDV
jgi:hypothetical protein